MFTVPELKIDDVGDISAKLVPGTSGEAEAAVTINGATLRLPQSALKPLSDALFNLQRMMERCAMPAHNLLACTDGVYRFIPGEKHDPTKPKV